MFDTESNWSFQSTERGSFCSQVSVINVVLIVDNEEREMIPNVPVKRDLDDSICLAPLLSEIEKSGYSLEATQIYYYSMENDWFVFCGRHSSLNINMIPEKELDLDCLTLKVKHPLDLSALRSSDDEAIVADLFTSSQEEEKKKEEPVAPGRRGKKSAKGRASSKRSTERKIGFVIDQVARWRQMYKNGIEKDGKLVGYSLQDAAKVIGISKKSLDDYLLQIRYGKKFGFDFQKHSESGVGVLRAFNKQHRDRMTLKKKPETDDDWMNFQSKCFTPFDEDTSCGESSNGSHSPRIEPEFDAIEMSLLASH